MTTKIDPLSVKSTSNSKSSLLHYGRGGKHFQYLAALAASLSAFSIGNVIAWTSQISQRLVEGEMGFAITEDQLGWIGSLMPLGAVSLTLFVGYACDKIGRKPTKLLLILPMAAGWALLAWASNIQMVYAGRFLNGMATGAFMVTTPLYCHEVSQKEIRGTLGSFTQLAISLGIFFDVIVGKFLSIQVYTICCFSIPLVFGCIFVFVPESPVYYLKKNCDEKAGQVLAKLRNGNHDIEKEMLEVKISLSEEHKGNVFAVLKESWKLRSTRMSFMMSLILMLLRVFCGIDAITAYTTFIFANATSNFDPSYGTMILMSVQLSVGILQSLVVDRVGRRILLIISEIVISGCLLAVGICFLLKNREIIQEEHYVITDYLALAALAIFIVGFSLGIGPIPLMLNTELNPPETKSLVTSFNTFCSWLTVFIVTKTFLIIEEAIGVESAFIIYGLLSSLGVVFIIAMVPETKGKTPEEIRTLLEKR